MRKAPPIPKSGALHYKKSNTTIVVRSGTKNQDSALLELLKYIRLRRLTDCLQLLENAGLTGDLAIFVLANVQSIFTVNKGGQAR